MKDLPRCRGMMRFIYNDPLESAGIVLGQPRILTKRLIRRYRAVETPVSHRFMNSDETTHTSARPLAVELPCSNSTVYLGWDFSIVANACRASSKGTRFSLHS